jgi:hypothetical protein
MRLRFRASEPVGVRACHSLSRSTGLRGQALRGLASYGPRVAYSHGGPRAGWSPLEFLPSQPGSAAHALHLLGDLATYPDRLNAGGGKAHYREALTLAEPRRMRPLAAHCHLGLGKLYRRTGDREQAQEHLTTATTMYREMDMRFWLEQAETELRALG